MLLATHRYALRCRYRYTRVMSTSEISLGCLNIVQSERVKLSKTKGSLCFERFIFWYQNVTQSILTHDDLEFCSSA